MNGIITVGIIVGAGISALELLVKVAGAFVLGLKNKVSKYRAEKSMKIFENIKNHLQINNNIIKNILEKPSEEKPSEEKLKTDFRMIYNAIFEERKYLIENIAEFELEDYDLNRIIQLETENKDFKNMCKKILNEKALTTPNYETFIDNQDLKRGIWRGMKYRLKSQTMFKKKVQENLKAEQKDEEEQFNKSVANNSEEAKLNSFLLLFNNVSHNYNEQDFKAIRLKRKIIEFKIYMSEMEGFVDFNSKLYTNELFDYYYELYKNYGTTLPDNAGNKGKDCKQNIVAKDAIMSSCLDLDYGSDITKFEKYIECLDNFDYVNTDLNELIYHGFFNIIKSLRYANVIYEYGNKANDKCENYINNLIEKVNSIGGRREERQQFIKSYY